MARTWEHSGFAAILLLGALRLGCSGPSAEGSQKPPGGDSGVDAAPPPPSSQGLVVGFYDEALDAGQAVLEEGGSAADAFVAVTLVDYVRAPGVTSLGGPLAAMTYDAASGDVETLDAAFNAVKNPSGLYDPQNPKLGASVLVPGALRGLETLWKKYGKLGWSRLVEPARRLAADGFPLDALYAKSIATRSALLQGSVYGGMTFFANGKPLPEGAILKQPVLAKFLADVASQGSTAMYEGSFAAEFVTEVNLSGGLAALDDLSSYQAVWRDPWSLGFKGATVYTNSGRMYGGVYGLLGLSVLAHDARDPAGLSELDRLDVRIRTARALYDGAWFYDPANLDDGQSVLQRLSASATDPIWASVSAGLAAEPEAGMGSHSLHVTVVDRAGNAVTGTNTINSLPWGSGLFVRGVALTDAGTSTAFVPGPGQRVVNALSLHVALRDKQLRFIGGTFGASLLETELQVLADAVGESLPASEIVARHRFGTFPFDFQNPQNGSDTSKNWLDPNVSDEVFNTLELRGLSLVRDPYGDTGWGSFAVRESDDQIHPGLLDTSWLRGGYRVVP